MNIYVLHISFNVILTDDGTNYLVTYDGANLSPKSLQYLLQWCFSKNLGSLESTQEALSCSPNFPPASYLDERTPTYEPIVNYHIASKSV